MMRETGVAGPVFISIGDAEKLQLFLELNPDAPKELFLVDGYEFDAYKTIGFGRIGDSRSNTLRGARKMKFPLFGLRTLRKYLANALKLAPIRPRNNNNNNSNRRGNIIKERFPEGVTRLGGTIGVGSSGDIRFAYEDGVPGDYPRPEDVLKALE